MKCETIEKAVKSINRSIKFYQRKLTYQLEVKAEVKLQNGNLKVKDYEYNIEKYEHILADLATIKRAIKNNRTLINIYGNGNGICYEIAESLKKAGISYDDGSGYGLYIVFNDKTDDVIEENVTGVPDLDSIRRNRKCKYHSEICVPNFD